MHQPATAAMIGFSVAIPTVGTQRHNSGRSVTSAPDENARPPVPVRIATRCAERSNSANAACSSTATALLIALSFSGRLIAITETGPRCSMVTTDILQSFLLSSRRKPGSTFRRPRQLSSGSRLAPGRQLSNTSTLKLPKLCGSLGR